MLELTVLGGVDQRVDDAVGQLHSKGEVVIPASEVDSLTADDIHHLRWSETDDEPTAHNQ